jgi:MFS family permease
MAFNAGWALGPATAGILAKYSFLWLFVGDAVTSLAYGLIALVFLPKGIRSERKEAGWAEAAAIMRRDRKFQRLLLSSLLIGFVFFQMVSTFGLHVTRLGFSAATYGMIISLNGLLVVLFELPLTTVSQRFGFERTMIVGYIFTAIGFGGNAFATTIPGIIACLLVWSVGEMLTMPVAVAQIADLAPAHMRGRYMGAFGFTWATALMIGPLIGTSLFRFNPAALWLACSASALLAAYVIRRAPREPAIEPKLVIAK